MFSYASKYWKIDISASHTSEGCFLEPFIKLYNSFECPVNSYFLLNARQNLELLMQQTHLHKKVYLYWLILNVLN